jgi:hypothetical protein
MNLGVKVFLRTAGFGVGIVAAVGIAIGAWLYVTSLPFTPGPWDREKIKANFADIEVNTGDKLVGIFRYTVENTTQNDYHLPDDPKARIRLQRFLSEARSRQSRQARQIHEPPS